MLALLACPGCGGPLTAGADALNCAAEGARFRIAPPGLADLRLPETAATAAAFAASYRAGRLAEGWQSLSPEVARALPDADPPGYNRLYWSLRRLVVLGRITGELGPAPRRSRMPGRASLVKPPVGTFSTPRGRARHQRRPDFGLGAGRLYPGLERETP
jgi:hypothetical protein